MSGKVFLDTNLWVYFFVKQPQDKCAIVTNLISSSLPSISLSTQVLGELYNVLTRKSTFSKQDCCEIIGDLIRDFPVLTIETSQVLKAIEISNRYNYSYWDSLIIATAVLNDCTTVYSEDMQHNQLIDDKTRIYNPLLI